MANAEDVKVLMESRGWSSMLLDLLAGQLDTPEERAAITADINGYLNVPLVPERIEAIAIRAVVDAFYEIVSARLSGG